MKTAVATAISLGATAALATVQGFDISNYQPNVNFASAYSAGARFVIIKVRERERALCPFSTPSGDFAHHCAD